MLDLEHVAPFLDCRTFLESELGLQKIKVVGNNEIRILCPSPTHNDKKPSCYFNTRTLMYHCFGCGERGTIINLIKEKKGMDFKEATAFLMRYLGMNDDNREVKHVRNRIVDNAPEFQLSSNYKRDWSQAPPKLIDFVTRRRFNLKMFEKYFIGYNPSLMTVTMPVIHGQKVVNIGERYINPRDDATKIMYQKDSKLAGCLWGLFEGYSKRDPYFTEGIFDAIRLREAGYNAFAILTNQLPVDKIRLIMSYFNGAKKFTLVPDNDKGGQDMVRNWKTMLNYVKVDVVVLKGYKDADEIPVSYIDWFVAAKTDLRNIVYATYEVVEETCNEIRRG